MTFYCGRESIYECCMNMNRGDVMHGINNADIQLLIDTFHGGCYVVMCMFNKKEIQLLSVSVEVKQTG